MKVRAGNDWIDMLYEEAVAFIESVPKFTTKNEPGNTIELIARLGHPEEAFRIVHVAGTNGKGSVCAFLEAMLRKGGYCTGLFTSPHLVRINERFQIDRQEVSDADFVSAFERVQAVIGEMVADGFKHPTYFEILFAVGLVIFQRAGIDWLVMETGLGGRMDATNVAAHPAACVITSISLDHTEYLGDTIAKIAGEKAGIIKEGVPVIYDASVREAAQVIEERAAAMHAQAIPWYPQMAQITDRGDAGITFVLNNRLFDYRQVSIPFMADYQVANASLALMALRTIDREGQITDEAALEALSGARWDGRMEQIAPGIVLDGAHNADGIEQFLRTVREVEKRRPVSLLFSAVVEKDYEDMIRELATEAHFASIVVTRVGGSRQVDPAVFAQAFRKYTQAPVTAVEDPIEAFDTALAQRPEGGMLFCAGSLYLVGDILRERFS